MSSPEESEGGGEEEEEELVEEEEVEEEEDVEEEEGVVEEERNHKLPLADGLQFNMKPQASKIIHIGFDPTTKPDNVFQGQIKVKLSESDEYLTSELSHLCHKHHCFI